MWNVLLITITLLGTLPSGTLHSCSRSSQDLRGSCFYVHFTAEETDARGWLAGPRWFTEEGQSGTEAQVCLTQAGALPTRALRVILTDVEAGAGAGHPLQAPL